MALEEGARLDLVNQSTRGRSRLQERLSGYRFGVVLLLLLVTFIFLASGPTGNWAALVAVVLQGATLLAALSAAEAHRALWRIALVVILVTLASAVVGVIVGVSNVTGLLFLLSLFLVAGAPIVIVRALVRRRMIDYRTVMGALCVYVLLGMLWSFAFGAVGELGSVHFFAQQHSATVADYLYFSFVTLTTVGYGDLTAATGLGRALAVLEALLGQIYLVTVVALLVSNISHRAGSSTEA